MAAEQHSSTERLMGVPYSVLQEINPMVEGDPIDTIARVEDVLAFLVMGVPE